MTLPLAAGFDIPAWGGFVVPLVIALLAGLWFLIRVGVREGGSTDLVNELRAQLTKAEARIKDLEDDLDKERHDRAEEARQNGRDLDVIREEFAKLRTELAVTKEQLDTYRRGPR